MFRRENKRIGGILWLLALGLISGFPGSDTTTMLTVSDKPAEKARDKEAAQKHRKRSEPVRRRAEHRPVRRDEKSDRAVVQGREGVEARLQQRLSGIEFVETPLDDCLAWFSQQLKLDILGDDLALAEEGIATDTPVTLTVRYTHLPAETALTLLLRPLELAYLLDDGFLRVTTQNEFEEARELRVYNCSDLIGPSTLLSDFPDNEDHQLDERAKSKQQAESQPKPPQEPSGRSRGADAASTLVRVLQRTTSGPWMSTDGVGGTIDVFQGLLIVWQNQRVHREIADLLQQIREAKAHRHDRSAR